jgi:zinc transport system substrate-binding protein
MNKKLVFSLAGFLLVAVISYALGTGLFSNRGVTNNGKMLVSASFYPMYYFASEIGRDKVEVLNVTPAGSEPHDYEPTPKDIANIEKGKLLILNGGGLEPWGDAIKDNLKNSRVVIVTSGEDLISRNVDEEGKTIKDPHVWLDPLLAKKEVEKILTGFVSADPNNKDFYQNNANDLLAKLDTLDGEYRQGLASCQKAEIFTSHAAFGYLAAQYHLNQVAISGISPDEEPSAQKLSEIANLAKEQNIKYIFFESLVSPKLSETIANEVGAKTLILDPIEGIANSEISKGETYFTKMEANLANLRIALECK